MRASKSSTSSLASTTGPTPSRPASRALGASSEELGVFKICVAIGSVVVSAFGVAAIAGVGCVIPISTTPMPDSGTSTNPSGSSSGSGSSGSGSSGSGATVPDAAIPTGKWTNVTGTLANIPSVCGSIPDIIVKQDEDVMIAGVAGVGLWASRDGGSWQELSQGDGSTPVTNRLTSITVDPLDTKHFWESGVYGPGVFETMDDGNTFVELGTVQHCDLLAVDLADPNRLMLVGGHEIAQTLYKSTDRGMTWVKIGSALPTTPYCTLPIIIDTTTYLVGCYGNGPTGVYRTTDGAATWTRMTPSGGGAAPLIASDKSIYWTTENNLGLTRSTDNGLHWADVVGPGVITTKTLVELPGGRLAALGTQYIMISSDHGEHWAPATSAFPPNMMETIFGFTYSARRKAFYIWQNHCDNGDIPVTTDAVMRYDFD